MNDATVFKAPRTTWIREAHNAKGKLLWRDEAPNIVFTAAINDILEVYFRGGFNKPEWFIGLLNGPASMLATDTMASHPGWTENVNYSSNTRPKAQFSPVTNRQLSSVANKAVFTMTGVGGTILGTFLVSDATKSGVNGVLYAAAPFVTGPKTLVATDVLTISVLISGV